MPVYDVVVIGAGHNGLTSACYLAKAGLNVLVLERRPVVGGAVCTEEILQGYKIDVGSSVHIMFRSTPIMDELNLSAHGLEYIELDPWAFYPVPNSTDAIHFYRDVDKTCESIEKISRRDAFAYERFIKRWEEINVGVWDAFLNPPTPGHLMGAIAGQNARNPKSMRAWSSTDTTRQLLTSYGRLIEETFESEPVRAALMWLAAQSGPPPDELGTGDLVGWTAMIHRHGAWRAKGGSGMLSVALASALEGFGGTVLTQATVKSIGRGPRADVGGPRYLIKTEQGEFHARSVLSACHVQTALLKLLDGDLVGPDLRRRVRNTRVGNGFGMMVRHAVSELPQYSGQIADHRGVADCHGGMQLLCPSTLSLREAYGRYMNRETPDYPAVIAMTFSAIDPTLAPEGGHTLFTWAQYYPYDLAENQKWDDLAEEEADRIYEVVCQYAPNMEGKMLGRYIQHPLELERRLGLLRGNVMHLEMSLDQMFAFRPLPELSTYRTPIEGLYLTGASTHPGGGVFGASGRNAASVMLQDFRQRKI
jgi:phytoene dehydrogenase-like protein